MKNAKIGLIIAIISLIGSILGFFRDSYLASIFGANIDLDAYFISFSVTNLLVLLLWNGISSSMLPTLIDAQTVEGKAGKDKIFSTLRSNLLVDSVVL
mgnify:CR=1 FL=1